MPALQTLLSNKNSSSLLTARIAYICLALGLCLLGLLHDVLVRRLELFYFLSQGLQGLRDLIYDLIQIIYYYAHFWYYFYFRFLH